jgi:aryl-alcohol dehydrogenase-like predicted oxidoreductase
VRTRALGRTGLQVSEIGFGAWAIGGNRFGSSYGPTDDKVSRRAVRRALDLGCTFFDTADFYGFGHSEEVLGEALGADRLRVVLATKCGGNFYEKPIRTDFSPEYIVAACERSLERLRTDYLDLLQLHNPDLATIQKGDCFEALEVLKKEGKILHHGVSVHTSEEGLAVVRDGRPEAVQAVYNVFSQRPARDLLPAAEKSGTGIIAREPLANGFLTAKYADDAEFPAGDIRHGWPREAVATRARTARELAGSLARDGRTMAQTAILFALSHPAVSVTIPGAKTPEQVEENLGAWEAAPLVGDEVVALRRLFGGPCRVWERGRPR